MLYRIPMAVLRPYARMVEPLQAQESMREAERLGVGTGALPAHTQREIRRKWNAELGTNLKSTKRTVPLGSLGGFGIKVTKVPATKRR